jgi:hypothetical protein
MSQVICRNRLGKVLTAIVSVLSLAAAASAQWVLIDDFNDGNDEGWTHQDLLASTPWGPTIYDASSFEYHISSTAPIPLLNEYVFTGSYWTESAVNPVYSEGFLRTTVRSENLATHMGTVMRWDFEALSGYGFGADNMNDTIVIARLDAGELITLAGAPFTLEVGRNYIMEAGTNGPNLSLKVWAEGGSVPPNPQVTWVDATYALGAFGLYVVNQTQASGGVGGPFSGYYDDVYFIPEPASLVMLALSGLMLARRRTR